MGLRCLFLLGVNRIQVLWGKGTTEGASNMHSDRKERRQNKISIHQDSLRPHRCSPPTPGPRCCPVPFSSPGAGHRPARPGGSEVQAWHDGVQHELMYTADVSRQTGHHHHPTRRQQHCLLPTPRSCCVGAARRPHMLQQGSSCDATGEHPRRSHIRRPRDAPPPIVVQVCHAVSSSALAGWMSPAN